MTVHLGDIRAPLQHTTPQFTAAAHRPVAHARTSGARPPGGPCTRSVRAFQRARRVTGSDPREDPSDLPRGRGVGSPRATAPHTRLELRPSLTTYILPFAAWGRGHRVQRRRGPRVPNACEAPASLGPGRGEAGALVDLLRVQQAGRATTTILALRSGESRALPPRGSIPQFTEISTPNAKHLGER